MESLAMMVSRSAWETGFSFLGAIVVAMGQGWLWGGGGGVRVRYGNELRGCMEVGWRGGEGVHSYRWQHMCGLLPATRVSHDLSALLITAQEQEQGGCSLLRGYN